MGKKNKFKYILLSQDEELHEYFLEKVVQLPILYFQNNSILQIKQVTAALKLKIKRKQHEEEKKESINNIQMRREKRQILKEERITKNEKLKKQRNKLGIKIKKKKIKKRNIKNAKKAYTTNK